MSDISVPSPLLSSFPPSPACVSDDSHSTLPTTKHKKTCPHDSSTLIYSFQCAAVVVVVVFVGVTTIEITMHDTHICNDMIGQWKASMRDGVGSFYYTDGRKIYGEWEEDQLLGTVVATLRDGSR